MTRTRTVCLVLLVFLQIGAANGADDAAQIRDLVAGADSLTRMGVVEMGAGRSFVEAAALLASAQERLAKADLSPADAAELSLEIDAVGQDIELLLDLYGDRFYGVFPLARLAVPTVLADEGLVVSEQLFNAPDVAATMVATRKVSNVLDGFPHPHIVLRSSPTDRRLEYVAFDELFRGGRSTPHGRTTLVAALNPEDLAAFDRGEFEPQLIDQLARAVGAASLLVVTVGRSAEFADAHTRTIHGDYFQQGEVIQGSPVDAPLFLRVETFDYFGSVRDRRNQFVPILIVQLLLFALAVVWAARVKWSIGTPVKVFWRLAFGTALFLFGRLFTMVVLIVLRKYIPGALAMAIAGWWWPALLGLLVVIGGGLIAWIGQARLTEIVPGTRGARTVSSIFALVALGASSHFVAPTLLLDGTAGLQTLVPFLISTQILAVLFAFAARTGPPVPHWFTIGPLLVAPMLGIALLMASPARIWAVVGASSALAAAAWIRHRVTVARGTEEPEPTAEEAAEADNQKMIQLGKKLSRHS